MRGLDNLPKIKKTSKQTTKNASKKNDFAQEITELKKTPENLSIKELRELGFIFQEFVSITGLADTFANSEFHENKSYFTFFEEVPSVIFKTDENFNSWIKIVDFICDSEAAALGAKEIIDLSNHTLDFLKDLELINFISSATMTLTKLIKG